MWDEGEGRSLAGRNGKMHCRSRRGRGSGIFGKKLRDNDGKILLPAGMATTSKGLPYKGNSEMGKEDLGLAHEVVVAMRGE